jgi:phage-related minor tail protein
VTDAAEAIKNYTVDKRDEAARKAKAALDALDVRIHALEARIDRNWEKMDKVSREQARSTLEALQKQRVEVAEWYGGLKNSTADAWEHTKKGFSDAYKSLRNTWEKADREYREDEKK